MTGASGYQIAYRKKGTKSYKYKRTSKRSYTLSKLSGKILRELQSAEDSSYPLRNAGRRTRKTRDGKPPCDQRWSQGGFLIYDCSKQIVAERKNL